jgi:hypothetical protein
VKTKALAALLGATAILAVPVLTPNLAGSSSYAMQRSTTAWGEAPSRLSMQESG